MKKFLFSIVLLVASFQFISAQSLDTLISDFIESENAHHQLIDKETLTMSLEAVKSSDAAEALASQVPPFMQRLDLIEILDLTKSPEVIKDKFIQRFDAIEDTEDYETLTNVSDGTDKARILVKKDGTNISEILIIAIDTENKEIAVVKMQGQLNESDLEDIMKQQTK